MYTLIHHGPIPLSSKILSLKLIWLISMNWTCQCLSFWAFGWIDANPIDSTNVTILMLMKRAPGVPMGKVSLNIFKYYMKEDYSQRYLDCLHPSGRGSCRRRSSSSPWREDGPRWVPPGAWTTAEQHWQSCIDQTDKQVTWKNDNAMSLLIANLFYNALWVKMVDAILATRDTWIWPRGGACHANHALRSADSIPIVSD